jgi:ABC-type Co2+ transport system permease subunit
LCFGKDDVLSTTTGDSAGIEGYAFFLILSALSRRLIALLSFLAVAGLYQLYLFLVLGLLSALCLPWLRSDSPELSFVFVLDQGS